MTEGKTPELVGDLRVAKNVAEQYRLWLLELLEAVNGGPEYTEELGIKSSFKRALGKIAEKRAASPVSEVVTEPVAWISFADNGNVRLWTTDQARAQQATGNGLKMTPLFPHPPSNNHFLIEALRNARPLVEKWCHYQGNTQELFDQYLGPIDAALSALSGGNTQRTETNG